MTGRSGPSLGVLAVLAVTGVTGVTGVRWCAARAGEDLPDVFSEDLARFEGLSRSPVLELRLAGARGLASLGHPKAETALLGLLDDKRPEARREAAFGLGRLGGRAALEALARRLEDADPWVRAQADLSLERLLGRRPAIPGAAPWKALAAEILEPGRAAKVAERLRSPEGRALALREAAVTGGEGLEEVLLELHSKGSLSREDLGPFFEALARVAGPRSVPVLAAGAAQHPAASWALGDVGGEEAERALLDALRRRGGSALPILVNLDRLRSRSIYPFAPALLARCFGLVSYRGLPDDLHLDPTPAQRVASRLLLRSGKAGDVVELLLLKLEGKPRPGAEALSPEAQAVGGLLDRMDPELAPGFQRADGDAEAQPLAALPHLVTEPALAPRLAALLDHRALVVRVYAASALARLKAPGAAEALARVLREGYPFPDAATLASGKHGPEASAPVRWKGFLAMALGIEGSEAARSALEALVADPAAPRDVRLGAAVGLGRIGDPRSRDALERARAGDPVRWIARLAREAMEAMDAMALREKEGR